ncbi:MAG TPA: NRDE family protein, partial [Blastocatellia bacterium]|nr:NRDE family protein [Blastocatellia bacterium]
MCTVSWLHDQDSYRLFSNRDERHSRQPALKPSIHEQRGVRFIAPIDGDHGGSWIGVNQFGISLCLLNRYHDADGNSPLSDISRGLLLIELIDCRSRSEAPDRIRPMNLNRFKPFTLLVLEPEQPSLLIHWNGRESTIDGGGEDSMPLISSSHDLPGVVSARRQHFKNL